MTTWCRPFSALLPALVLVVGTATARGQFVLTPIDGPTVDGAPAGVGADHALRWTATAGPRVFPITGLISVDALAASHTPAAGSLRLDLVGGDVVYGRAEDGTTDDLRLRVPGLGAVRLALDEVSVLWNEDLRAQRTDLPADDPTKDLLVVERDGRLDHVPGVVDRITPGAVVFTSFAGKARAFSFARDHVVAVRFARAEVPKRVARPDAVTLTMRDGSRLSGSLAAGEGQALRVDLAVGPRVTVEPAELKALAFRHDAIMWLADLTPTATKYSPLFGDGLAHAVRRNVGLLPGTPLMIGALTWERGLLIPARTRVSWPLAGGWSRFRAEVGVDPATRAAAVPGSVKLSFFADDKPVWPEHVLRSGDAPLSVRIDGLAGARELVAAVDFAAAFDAGAWAVLANAVLLK